MLEIFGPVPSRRLGQSLGINNIPPKHCTYSCVYCQLGKALYMTTRRQSFFSPEYLVASVRQRLSELEAGNETIDYLTVVPDGEPTLDNNLRELVHRLKEFAIPVAIVTNASLIWNAEVRESLLEADWVSLKVDAISDLVWRKIDRPHKSLDHHEILAGINQFAHRFRRNSQHKLMTETMLVEGINTGIAELRRLAEFIGSLQPDCAYLSIPTRPPAEADVVAADKTSLTQAYDIYTSKIPCVEYLIGYEGNSFSNTGNSRNDILSITAVHPMREDAIQTLLERNGNDHSIVEQLVREQLVEVSCYNGNTYYVRNYSRKH